MMALRILGSLPLWLGYSLLALTLDVVGLVLLAILSACHAWRTRTSCIYASDKGQPNSARYVTAWRGWLLTWLWGNEEDGVRGPDWWQQRTGVWGPSGRSGSPDWWAVAWSAYRWSALRNPSNNLRFVPGINPVIAPARVRSCEWDGGPQLLPVLSWRPYLTQAFFTWQGLYSGIRLHIWCHGNLYRFWWGWKLKPEDAQGVPADDMRAPRCGFGTQFKRIG